ncbi:MFS transporter [Blastococcus saxobsidens]|uniref:Putative MFS sugar transporter n=1 Tax=Blastococcus saxobsidens (strain DD2) TaxID=1146883 RepID=H6RKH2_BLASD|nr:MFS transporter [Blastococcus saxobsidens]CCG02391.1 putative MFS sugar transporter [Blastococcus saxobsidens DD2]
MTRPTVAVRSGGTLAAGCLVGGAAGWSLTAAGAGATGLEAGYGVDLVVIGLFTTAMAIPYALLQLPAGALVDRWGARRAGLLGLALMIAAYLAALTVPHTGLAMAARAVVGAGGAICFSAGADLARQSRTGPLGLGLFGGVAIGAGGAAVLVVPLLDVVLGWRSAWATGAAAALLAAGAVALALATTTAPVTLSAERPRLRGGASVLRDGQLHRLAAVHAVTLGLGVVLSNWVAVVFERVWGLPTGVAATLGSLVLLLAIVSRPLGGYLARRHPASIRPLVVGALVASAAATAALAWPSGVVVAGLAVGVLGMASGLPFAAVMAAAQTRRADRPAAAVGLMNAQANLLVLLGAPLLGAAIQHTSSTAGLLVVAALWLVPLLTPSEALGRRVHPEH